ncbi:MAG: fibronectin type III domain-containing protein [Bacteroidales bacterium]|nr:fibronectin type III domain-containing protein [Bacteroidales bacterium]
MKKVLLSLVMVVLTAVSVNAQAIYGYGFSINEESYTALTDATVIASGTDEALKTIVDEYGDEVNNFVNKLILPSGVFTEEVTAAGYPIGFDFNFNEKTFTSFGIATNGAIYFGNEEVTLPAEEKWVFTRENTKDLVGFVPNRGTVCNDETVISYKTEGEAPNRTLTVEFKQLGALQGYWGVDAYYFDVQFRLHEGSNAIELVLNGVDEALTYQDEEGNPETDVFAATIGIKGEGEAASSVFAGTMAEWAKENSTANTFELDNTIADGTTFVLNYPTEVTTPTVQPTDLVVNQFSTSLTGRFTPAEGVDQYLLVYQEGKEITTLPVNKTNYETGDKLGDATVIEYYESWDFEGLYEFEIYDLPAATDYTFAVFAVNAFGLNGPAYNTVEPLTVVTYTKPLAPATFEFTEIGETTAKVNLAANEAGNKVIVVYNTELVRDNYGDYPVIGPLAGEYTSGQEIEGGGKVAYFGEAGEGIEITDLEHSKGYFFEAYSYDPTYGYSTDKLSSDQATIAHLPYELNLDAVKTYEVPAGWYKNEGSTFEVPRSVSGFSTEENPYLLWCKVVRGNATDGVINQITSSPIVIGEVDAEVKFNFTIFHNPSRFLTEAYNVWNENDVFAVQVSTDGETFTDLVSYNSTNNPQFVYTSEEKTLVPFEAALTQYKGQKIWIRIHWHLFNNTFAPGTLVIDNFKVREIVVTSTPEVKVEDVAHTSAKVTWRSEQENFEVTYAKADAEFDTTIVVTGAKELILTELEAETEYQVKVRGIVEEGEYSDWSEVVKFTTTEWPECDAPTNLAVQYSEELIILTWEGTEDHLLWELRYREANSTSWITIDSIESTTWVIEDLTEDGTYLWNVRAFCTAGRTTAWSAQGSFTVGSAIPVAPVVTASVSHDTIQLRWLPVHGATSYKAYYGDKMLAQFKDAALDIQVPEVGTYCFTVTAVNDLGESPKSNEACATVEADPETEIPEAPVLEARIENDSVILTWNAVEDATYYSVYQSEKLLGTTGKLSVTLGLEVPGIYCFTVTATNLAGESEHSAEVCVTYGEGVEELSSSINIYPNPVNDKLYIETQTQTLTVEIYDIYGRIQNLSNSATQQLSNSIDVTNLNSGVYFVKVVTENGEVVKRFVKK